ncbi:MAG: DUF4386 domain-containing protein [Chloroflexia bacterium]|nr:DUF4386 domain-containing protein [Chloroflexia bacterium]
METNKITFSSKKLGRITGVFYLLIILSGLFGGMAVRGTIVVPNDPSTTLQNLISNESLFRIGFISDLIMVLSDVMVSVLFYYLLKQTNKVVAVFAAVFRLIQSAVLAGNLINLFSPILMIKGHETMDQTQINQLGANVLQKLEVFEYGYLISGVFFAFNCLLMGYLLYKSELIPNLLGIMIAVASLGYLFNCLTSFLAPSLIEVSQLFMFFTAVIAELTLCIWLIIKGTKISAFLEIG